jgi:iron complex outermembrane receptor protein
MHTQIWGAHAGYRVSVVSALVGLCAITACWAADVKDDDSNLLEEVVVTGTRLGEVSGFSTPTPVTVLNASAMQRLALTNVADALNQLPSFAPITTPASNEYFTSGNIGQNVLDLRGLGAQRTLVLLDGRRIVPSNANGTVDVNLIPSSLLERSEVVTGGASAAYGSDAVAGVVNMILKKDLEGFTFQTSYGRAEAGDDGKTNVAASFGTKFADGRGHFEIGAEYENDQGTGTCYSRSWCYRNVNVLSNPTPGANGYPVQVLSGNQYSTLPQTGLIMTGVLTGTSFGNNGQPTQFHFGQMAGALLQLGGSNDNGQQSWYSGYLLEVPVSRESVLSHSDYSFTDHIKGFLEVSYGQTTGTSMDYPYLDIYTQMSADNAFLPASLRSALAGAGQTSFFMNRSDDDLGYQIAKSENQTRRVAFGLNGDFGNTWHWDGYFQYGKNEGQLTISNDGNTANHINALDAVTGPNGQIVCRSTLTNPNNGCVALDLFGYNQFSPAAKQYVTGTAWQSRDLDQYVGAANLRGTLFNTWAGPVNAAAGVEHREDKASGAADPISEAFGWQNSTAAPIAGEIRVSEAYVETAVPLLADQAFAKRFELNGAVRYTHYNLSGDQTTWKGGAIYEPIDGVLFRATKSRDIRAPNINELFAPTSTGLANILDPKTGVQNLVPYVQTGNPNLLPEKADTFTTGIVLRPSGMFTGFRMSVDYYDIKINGAIDTLDAQSLVTACYDGTTAACAEVQRNADGTLTKITLGDLNLDHVQTEGVDVAIDYLLPLSKVSNGLDGKLDFAIYATHVTSLTTTYYNGISVNWAGNPGTPTTGPNLEGVPDWSVDAMMTYSLGAGSVTLQGRFIDGGTYDARLVGPGQAGYSLTASNSISNNSVPSTYYLKLAGQYNFTLAGGTELQLFGAIGNLLNRNPPAEPPSYLIYYYDTIGRTFTAGVRAKF